MSNNENLSYYSIIYLSHSHISFQKRIFGGHRSQKQHDKNLKVSFLLINKIYLHFVYNKVKSRLTKITNNWF